MAEKKIVLPQRTEISELNITTGSIIGSLQDVKARAVETEGDLKQA